MNFSRVSYDMRGRRLGFSSFALKGSPATLGNVTGKAELQSARDETFGPNISIPEALLTSVIKGDSLRATIRGPSSHSHLGTRCKIGGFAPKPF